MSAPKGYVICYKVCYQIDQTIGQRFHGIYKGNILHSILSLWGYQTHAETRVICAENKSQM